MSFHNLACMTSSTTGTGTLTLGSAVSGFLSFAGSGVANSEKVIYSIRDGTDSEIGLGTYTSAGTTLSRDVVYSSTNSGSKISCTGNQQVFITPNAETLNLIDVYGIHHRLSGSNSHDDEFSTDTSGSYTTIAPTGTANWSIGNHTLNAQFTSQSANDASAFVKAATLADGEWFETCFQYITQPNNYTFIGLIITDGTTTTSNALCLSFYVSGSSLNGRADIRWDKGTVTNLSASSANTSLTLGNVAPVRLKMLRTNSTTFHYYFALGPGSLFYDWGAATVDPGFTPTHAGVFVSTYGSAHNAIVAFDYFRHMS